MVVLMSQSVMRGQLLKVLKDIPPLPWLCIGDFNEILCQFEKFGTVWKSPYQIKKFQQALDDCELSSLDYTGPRFTRCNNRRDYTFTKESMDGMVANKEWVNNHSHMDILVLSTCSSDHCPLLMRLGEQDKVDRKVKPFRFETSWTLSNH